MQKQSGRTRQALVRATVELLANGRFADAGLVNICRLAGVSRGALYHHFSSTSELVAEVHAQAKARTAVLAGHSSAGTAAGAPERFSVALGAAMGEEELVRAGMRVAANGSGEPPWLRDEVLARVRAQVLAGAPDGEGDEDRADREALADLAVVVTAGLESLGYTDGRWWDPATAERIWAMLRPLFAELDASGSRETREIPEA
ncbi:TetR family transcriptional regulator [Streptomyces sp. NPDC059443]|uniref:TetR family transcriptional regulator n=1 Tax=unclassified Streptomyces TaxID=2593676 RepID=UPI003678073D